METSPHAQTTSWNNQDRISYTYQDWTLYKKIKNYPADEYH